MRRHRSEKRLGGEGGGGGKAGREGAGGKREGGVYSGRRWERQQLLHTPQPQGRHAGIGEGTALSPHQRVEKREEEKKKERDKTQRMGKGEWPCLSSSFSWMNRSSYNLHAALLESSLLFIRWLTLFRGT